MDSLSLIQAINAAVKILDAASISNCKESQAIYNITFHASRHLNKQIVSLLAA